MVTEQFDANGTAQRTRLMLEVDPVMLLANILRSSKLFRVSGNTAACA
jgi:hypothetical protein